MNERVEDYWAGQLSQAEVFRNMLGAANVELIKRCLHDNPPNALFDVSYSDGDSQKLWCEITGAWHSEQAAKETFQRAEGRISSPVGSHGVIQEPDALVANSVSKSIMRTLEKRSYRRLISEHGPGHLHVYVSSNSYGLFDTQALSHTIDFLPVADLGDQSMFQSISLGYHGEIFCLWRDRLLMNRVP